MKTTRVYDVPTRLFHWLFAALFLTAFIIAQTADDESPLFAYHMLAGFILGFIVLLRIVWGFVGSRYARFSSFQLSPAKLFAYFRSLLTSSDETEPGHNPASSWAALTMLGLTLGLAITGIMMANNTYKEVVEEVHELFANAFIVVVVLHVAGVIFHKLRHQDGLASSMLSGMKKTVGPLTSVPSHRGVGLLFILLVSTFVFHLNKNYDRPTQTLKIFGSSLQLGSTEDESAENEGAHGGSFGEDNDDDD